MNKLHYNRIGIVLKKSVSINGLLTPLLQRLAKSGANVLFYKQSPHKDYTTFTKANEVDVLVVFGGDGTIIKTIRELAHTTLPIISVNLGTVGFMADLSLDEATECLPQLLQGKAIEDTRFLMQVAMVQNDKEVFSSTCINDVVLAKGKIARLIDIEAKIDGTYLTDYNADGLLISTPTGSTAYNLSAGGPIMHPSVQAMILTAINPYSLAQKPVVVPGSSVITLEPKFSANTHDDEAVYLTVDGQTFREVEPGTTISVSLSTQSITFLRQKSDSFFHTLRSKLKWGDKPTVNHHANQVD